MHIRKSFRLSAYISYANRKSFQFTAIVTSQFWQLDRNSFLKYSPALRQTSWNLYPAKKIRQHDVDKFMIFISAKKTRQHDVDKFMKVDKMNEFARLVRNVIAFGPLSHRKR